MSAVLERPVVARAGSLDDPSTTLVQDLAAADQRAVVAALVVEAACVEQIRRRAPRSSLSAVHAGDAVGDLLDVCSAVLGDDPRADLALGQLRALTSARSLGARRVPIAAERVARTVAALHRAEHRGDTAAFETLLRRGLHLLLQPLVTD